MFGCFLLLAFGEFVCEDEREDSGSANDNVFCRCGCVGPGLVSTSPSNANNIDINKIKLRTLLTVALAKHISR